MHTTVDAARCIGCGECVRVCPSGTLAMVEGKASVTGPRSIQCGHCQAVCPVEAVHVKTLSPGTYQFNHIAPADGWSGFGKDDSAALIRLMASRRSTRNFTAAPVPRSYLDDLVKIGITAPSGTNSQRWTFTLLPTRQDVVGYADAVAGYFEKLNTQARRGWLRNGLKLIGKPELATYYGEYYPAVAKALDLWKNHGVDRLFHGATSAILVGSAPGASCPAEDALLATQNILLGAHTLGLGTCLVGYAVAAMQRDARIKEPVGIPRDEPVYAVIGLGWPKETYQRICLRKPPIVRVAQVAQVTQEGHEEVKDRAASSAPASTTSALPDQHPTAKSPTAPGGTQP